MASFMDLFDPDEQDTAATESHNDYVKMISPHCLPPEAAEGNIEYKLKLINPSESRFQHLVTQMKWRLREGHGEAIYEIGVEDKGMLVGLTEDEAKASLHTLYLMAEKLGASMTVLREKVIENQRDNISRKAFEVLVRKVPDDQQSIELRVAVLGNVDAGKSTLLGVLTQGEPDNGRGSARLNLFRHRHEIESGRTSSISREILGFDAYGTPITYASSNEGFCRTPEQICEASAKLVTFIDLAGHRKYLRTTLFGLVGHLPHLTFLVVSAVCGVTPTAQEHLGLALALHLPVVVVINKIDLATPESLATTIESICDLLKSPICKKVPLIVDTDDDAITAATCLNDGHVTPIFTVSCVNGYGLNLVYTFLNVIPPFVSTQEREHQMQMPAEFQIDETFHVPEVGLVVGGLLMSGTIREGDMLRVGPSDNAEFCDVQVSSLHRHKVPCRIVRAGESATLALSIPNSPINLSSSLNGTSDSDYESRSGTSSPPSMVSELPFIVRKGMVLRAINSENRLHPVCLYFQARIHILFHPSSLTEGNQVTIHCGNVRQTATIVGILGRSRLFTNETASVMFKFLRHPEVIHAGCRLLVRDARFKGIGRIIQVFPVTGEQPVIDKNNNI